MMQKSTQPFSAACLATKLTISLLDESQKSIVKVVSKNTKFLDSKNDCAHRCKMLIICSADRKAACIDTCKDDRDNNDDTSYTASI
mmetsp:Transcript_7912/g.14313  ORF Transcript_7912/g.14313 Transcript_7912/m.14313 type:complete len:86 (-) Transcript_7912:1167-1424(-)